MVRLARVTGVQCSVIVASGGLRRVLKFQPSPARLLQPVQQQVIHPHTTRPSAALLHSLPLLPNHTQLCNPAHLL